MNLRVSSAVILIVLAFVFGSCKKDDDPVGPIEGAPPPELVGTWSMQSTTVNGQPANIADVLQWEATTVASEFSVQASGLYSYIELNQQGAQTFQATGTMSIAGDAFTISLTSIGGTPIPARRQTGTWELVQGQLSLTGQQDVEGVAATVVVVCIRK